MKYYKHIFIILTFIFFAFAIFHSAHADALMDDAVAYLRLKQDDSGQITGGSVGDASPWAAIAFAAQGIDIATIVHPTNSLKDYLINNQPSVTSSALEWEKWMLALIAGGYNPYDFGGHNYVSTLQSSSYYIEHQLGLTNTVNDDWFGALALIASGVSTSDSILSDSIAFIVLHQNADGGWGYSITADSDSNDTAAALQALVAAKNYGVINNALDTAISKGKVYFLSTQVSNGGFLADKMPWTTGPDSDSTTWGLMALNVLGMQDSSELQNAKKWLLTQQSSSDDGFTACDGWDKDFNCIHYGSNTTTTAHALIGLAGKGWIIRMYTPSGTPTPTPTGSADTPTPTPTPTVTPTPTPTSSNSSQAATATPTPTSTSVQPTVTPATISSHQQRDSAFIGDIPTDTPSEDVLGEQNTSEKNVQSNTGIEKPSSNISYIFLGIGILLGSICGILIFKQYKNVKK